MKKALLFALAGTAAASAGLFLSSADAAQVPSPTAWGVVARGANHNTWERTEYELGPDGTARPRIGRYVELTTGLNFKDKNGQWTPSKEEIDLLPDGSAAALGGGTKAWFSSEISQGGVRVETPDGMTLRDEPVALVMEDGKNSVIIGVITNSVGELAARNEAIYPNAFAGVGASVEYVYRLSGLEQDVVLQSQLPDPQSLGLSTSSRVEVVSEFWTTNEPEETVGAVDAESGLSDTTLKFGGTVFVPGRAYAASAGAAVGGGFHRGGARVYKSWLDVPEADGSTAHFLVEELPYSKVAPLLEGLPAVSKAGGVKGAELARAGSLKDLLAELGKGRSEVTVAPGGGKPKVVFRDLLGAPRAVSYDKKGSSETRHLVSYDKRGDSETRHLVSYDKKGGSETCHLVSYENEKPGVVVDYQTVSGSVTNYTFQGDTTYEVSGPFSISGTARFEGNTVIKYDAGVGASLDVNQVVCETGPYRPAIFTASDDNTVGEQISGSSGSPSGYYADPALSVNTGGNTYETELKNLRISYATTAVYDGNDVDMGYNVWDSQFLNCSNAFCMVSAFYQDVYFYNGLISGVNCAFEGDSWDAAYVENATIANCNVLVDQCNVAAYFYNSILANVTNVAVDGYSTATGDHNGFYNSPTFGTATFTDSNWPFETVGAGSYYLADNTFRNKGLGTDDGADVLADIATKTTYPPVVYAGTNFTTATAFSPDVPRDTNAAPDLGFHYCALDDVFSSVNAYTNLTFTAGTAAGWYDTSTYPCYGIMLYTNVTAAFNGTATEPCWLARYDTVQEGGNGNWQMVGGGFALTDSNPDDSYSASSPHLVMQFTKCSSRDFDDAIYWQWGGNFAVDAKDCEFYGVNGGYNVAVTYTNCLFYRFPPQINTYGTPSLKMENCTVEGGNNLNPLTVGNSAPCTVRIYDCAFDGTSFSIDTNALTCDYNAFVTNAPRLPIQGAHDVIVTNYNWQSSWFGGFYLPSGSPLIDAGDVTADKVGLYHFTTQTSQVPETNSIVDIGYHYVATDANGNPLDSNGDGIADYLEDPDGDGIVNNGETPWDLGILSQPQTTNVAQGQNAAFSVVAAGAGPFTYQWRLDGVNISGANASGYTDMVVQASADGELFSVVVSNGDASVTSSNAVLEVTTPLSITSSPQSQTAIQGTNVSFNVGTTGTYPVYQWYGNGVALQNGGRIGGANAATLTITNVAGTDAGGYKATVTNLFGSLSSSTATLTVITNPWVVTAPAGLTATQADDVTLSVTATGYKLFYQWWLTNSLVTNCIPGATNSSYAKLVVQTNDAGMYSVTITNVAGSTNASAALNVLVPPWITEQPASLTVTQGDNATFSISAIGTANLAYQWFKNGTAIAGATNASLALANAQGSDAGGYAAEASNAAGTNMSAWAWLSVNLTGGGTTNGWGGGSGPPSPGPVVSMISPTNSCWTNEAVYLYGTNISIRAVASSAYSYVTNVAFYMTGTNYGTNFTLAGTAVPGANTRFALAWTNALPDTNILEAVARDCSGGVSTSAVVYVMMAELPAISAGPDETLVWPEGDASTNTTLNGSVSDDGLPVTGVTNIFWRVTSGNGGYAAISDTNSLTPTVTFTTNGTYQFRLRVDNEFATNTAECEVHVRRLPQVQITSPTNGATLDAGSSILLDATATSADSSIASVVFYNGTNRIGTGVQSLNNSYTYYWTNAPPGSDSLTAVATDGYGLTNTSGAVGVTVLTLGPEVQIVSPIGQTFPAWSSVTIDAQAQAGYSGASVRWVEFFVNGHMLGYAPSTNGQGDYQLIWTPPTGGTDVLEALAMDANTNSGWSAPVTNTVRNLPAVSIVSPANGAVLINPLDSTNIGMSATAVADGATITNVTFYEGTNVVGSTNGTSPYTITWRNVTNGAYTLTARATDNTGLAGRSYPVSIQVVPTNQPPLVDAGSDQTNRLPNAVQLAGLVWDDGLPVGGELTTWWTVISSPPSASVAFANSNSPVTTAAFSTTGVYVLQLSASDSQYVTSSDVSVTMLTNLTLTVNAGPDTNYVMATNWTGLATLTPYITNIVSGGAAIVGFDYYAISNGFIALVANSDGSFQFDTIPGSGGPATKFFSANWINYVAGYVVPQAPPFAVINTNLGGFTNGEIFAVSTNSEIMRIEPDGTVADQGNAWVVLPDTIHAMCHDDTGVFGGDLIAICIHGADGSVWRINSDGQALFVGLFATGGGAGEGEFDSREVAVAPDDQQKYGPMAGQILVSEFGSDSDTAAYLWSMDKNGFVYEMDTTSGTIWGQGPGMEVDTIPRGENLYYCDGTNLWMAPAAQFEGKEGDYLTRAYPHYNYGPEELQRVHWDGQAYDIIKAGLQTPPADTNFLACLRFAPLPTNAAGNVYSVQLQGMVKEDGVVTNLPGVQWIELSGPGPVTFDNTAITNATASFTQPGTYILRLTASDGGLTSDGDVTIQLNVTNNANIANPTPLDCGVPVNDELTTNSATDTTIVAGETHYANYYTFTGQQYQQVAVNYTNNSGSGDLFLILRDSTNDILDVSQERQTPPGIVNIDNALPFTLPYSGQYTVEVTTVGTDSGVISTGLFYSAALSCGPWTDANGYGEYMGAPFEVLLDGTNVPNGGTLSFGTTQSNIPVTLNLLIKNIGVTNADFGNSLECGDFSAQFPDATPSSVGNFEVPPGRSTTMQLTFNASSNEMAIGQLTLPEDTEETAQNQSYALTLVGNAVNSGEGPAIQLTSPQNNASFIAPTDITVTAETNGSIEFTNIILQAESPQGPLNLGSFTGPPYTVDWQNAPAGDYMLTAIAAESSSNIVTSLPVFIHVLSPYQNQPPVAADDYETVAMNSSDNVLDVLSNDSDPDGDPLTIVAVTKPQYGSAAIAVGGTAIEYTPPYFERGSDVFRYEISDGSGGTAWATVYMTVNGGDAPQATLTASSYSVTAGNSDTLTACVAPSNHMARVEFYRGTTWIGSVTNGENGPESGTFPLAWAATYGSNVAFTAVAIDTFGQKNTSAPIDITVNPPSGGGQPPVATIDSMTADGVTAPFTYMVGVEDGMFSVNGEITNTAGYGGDWDLSLCAADGTVIEDLTNGTLGVGESINGLLGHCDLSTLQNGVYELDLTATSDFMTTETNVPFRLESGLKLGQFSFSQQDLVIPVNGIPLTVTRTYNSLDADRGDTGYGWTLAVDDMDVQIDEQRQDVMDSPDGGGDTPGQTFSERAGGSWDVTLTLPNGRRTTFYFYLTPLDQGFQAYPEWQAAPGVTATLTPVDNPRLQVALGLDVSGGDNSREYYWVSDAKYDPGMPWQSYDFPGFVLKTTDGNTYNISRDDLLTHDVWPTDGVDAYKVHAYGRPHLSSIDERNGSVIEIGAGGITNVSPDRASRTIVFNRNAEGLISSIADPDDASGPPAVKYDYDSQDNLIAVERLVDRAGLGTYVTNSFGYTNAVFPHYITGIFNADGTSVAKNFYDDAGRLTGVQDAEGNVTRFVHEQTNDMEVVIDRLGGTNTYVYDARGNVIAQTNAAGDVTTMAYDANNNKTNEISWLDGRPYATNNYVYDENDWLLASRDALGHTNGFAYDANGDLLTNWDALGDATVNTYDSQGELTGTRDALGGATGESYQDGLLTGSSDPLGTITTNYYDGSDNLAGT
ncbi:MAG: cadherin-like domain-containing protein, partial [Verrucomicrobiota bacterium]|nr:cadherin-like domain-containing protein [Verrucomicrobiota bacterium]